MLIGAGRGKRQKAFQLVIISLHKLVFTKGLRLLVNTTFPLPITLVLIKLMIIFKY